MSIINKTPSRCVCGGICKEDWCVGVKLIAPKPALTLGCRPELNTSEEEEVSGCTTQGPPFASKRMHCCCCQGLRCTASFFSRSTWHTPMDPDGPHTFCSGWQLYHCAPLLWGVQLFRLSTRSLSLALQPADSYWFLSRRDKGCLDGRCTSPNSWAYPLKPS